TAIGHSFAASPRMLFPFASTFTWKLVNGPNCEIIRGEVSIFRGGAGGLSYFSSGSFRGTLRVGANWPGAVASPDSKSKQIKKRVLDTIKHLNSKKATVYQNTPAASIKFFQRKPATVVLV